MFLVKCKEFQLTFPDRSFGTKCFGSLVVSRTELSDIVGDGNNPTPLRSCQRWTNVLVLTGRVVDEKLLKSRKACVGHVVVAEPNDVCI